MTVSRILRQKGRDVFKMAEKASLRTVCEELHRRRIGAVVIVDAEDTLVGILSERDIVRAVAQKGAKALNQTASSVMTRAVEVCHPGDTIGDLMERMTRGRFRHMPVVDDGKLVGVVSIGDVVKERIAQAVKEAEDIREYIVATPA